MSRHTMLSLPSRADLIGLNGGADAPDHMFAGRAISASDNLFRGARR
jgi:hypothetical protein